MKYKVGDVIVGVSKGTLYTNKLGVVMGYEPILGITVYKVKYEFGSSYFKDGFFRQTENDIRLFTKLEKAVL